MKRIAVALAIICALSAADAAVSATSVQSRVNMRWEAFSKFFVERRDHREQLSATEAAQAEATRAALCKGAFARGDAAQIFIYC
jgi:hypothetical protein